MYDMTDPAAARRAAKDAERQRLKRAEARREHRDTSGISGFTQRKWRWLGVNGSDAVKTTLAMITELVGADGLPDHERAVLKQAIDGSPDREALLPAVRSGLSLLPPDSVLAHLRGLWAAGIRWLNDVGLERCRLLCSTAPSLDLVSRRSNAISGGPAFSLFATAATRGAVPVPSRYLPEVLPWAPLSVIDDLIDHGGLLADDAPWTARGVKEALYLKARLAPDIIVDDEAEQLKWTAYLRRNAFLNGATLTRHEPDDVWDLLYDVVMEGDISALRDLDAALPRPQQIELRDLQSGAVSGQWPMKMSEDRGLWLLMATLWKPSGVVDAGRNAFCALVALNRAYDLLKSGDIDAAAQQARSLVRAATGSGGVPAGQMVEGYTIAAYAAAVNDQLETAEEQAKLAAIHGGETAARNLALVQSWRGTRKNNRGPVSNPFLEVGLDHGAGGWEERCREIFRQHEGDPAAQSNLNRAEDRIRDALRSDAGWDVFFRLPVDCTQYVIPSVIPQHLVPSLESLNRRTTITNGSDLEAIRARAAVELLQDFRVTAPHLDRHGMR